jgi:tellurite methyltransferase
VILDPVRLRETFGEIDIYLFDQLLKGRLHPKMCILDAGCGGGRNLNYFLLTGFNAYGVDASAAAITRVRMLAAQLAPQLPPDNFAVSSLNKLPHETNSFDLVISNAVLHFAADDTEFDAWLNEMWRVLKPDGMFFARLASNIGIENLVQPISGRRFHLPDGSDRFLVDESMLLDLAQKFGADQLEPIKTTNVQSLRCMTTWVLRKK